ncbi:MAG: DUF3857 and transglutaminase domain-containing protein [Acidobacteria bacterium]|nr:DUF3857 and transglutaminase domain-containing protein [Acidobacteriota bacterium]
MRIFRCGALTIVFLAVACSAFAQIEWRPVSQAELDAKAPVVEPDADAEAIFWEVRLDDEKKKKLFYSHYVRVKIFTERGREKFAKFDIPFMKDTTVEEVAARVIKPDGSVISLSPGDIFERDIIRAGKYVIRAKSFAVPGIEPGVIVEYQYKETLKGDSADNERLVFQRDIPIQRITYFVRPYKDRSLRVSWRNMPEGRFVQEHDGYMSASAENVPALRDEPFMPPVDEVRRWALLNYNGSDFSWDVLGFNFEIYFAETTRIDKEIAAKAAELTAGIDEPQKQLRALFEFAQKKIRNVSYDPKMTPEQREKVENKRASDTLKRGMGHSRDVDLLFAALAKAVGFTASMIFATDRSESFADPRTTSDPRVVHWAGILVSKGTYNVPANPGTPFMPLGIIDWYEEGNYALVLGAVGSRWVKTTPSAPEKNLSKRTAKLKLLEDGSLEGFVRVEHSGHQATSRRRDLFRKSPEEREKILIDGWKKSLVSAEISMFAFENFEEASQPLTYSFNVRVPNYAQKTGKRMFLQPNFFEFGSSPAFSSSTRTYGISFDYSWSEKDTSRLNCRRILSRTASASRTSSTKRTTLESSRTHTLTTRNSGRSRLIGSSISAPKDG